MVGGIMKTALLILALAVAASAQQIDTHCSNAGDGQANCSSTVRDNQTQNQRHETGEAIGKLIAAKLKTEAAKKQLKKGADWCAAHPGHDHGYHFSDGTIVTCDNGVMTPTK